MVEGILKLGLYKASMKQKKIGGGVRRYSTVAGDEGVMMMMMMCSYGKTFPFTSL